MQSGAPEKVPDFFPSVSDDVPDYYFYKMYNC